MYGIFFTIYLTMMMMIIISWKDNFFLLQIKFKKTQTHKYPTGNTIYLISLLLLSLVLLFFFSLSLWKIILLSLIFLGFFYTCASCKLDVLESCLIWFDWKTKKNMKIVHNCKCYSKINISMTFYRFFRWWSLHIFFVWKKKTIW